MAKDFDDSGFDYDINLDEQSSASGGPFYYGNVGYYVEDFKIVSHGKGEPNDLSAHGDTEEEVEADLYGQLSALQEKQDNLKSQAEEAADDRDS